jgi:hypothetical protein
MSLPAVSFSYKFVGSKDYKARNQPRINTNRRESEKILIRVFRVNPWLIMDLVESRPAE